MHTTVFITILLLSLLMFVTIFKLTRWLHPVEILLLFLFTSYICQNMFYTTSSAYDRLSVTTEYLPFWTVRMQFGIVFAVALMWVVGIQRSSASRFIKISAIFLWMTGGILIEKGFLLVGILTSKGPSWYPSVDYFFEMTVILGTILFMESLPKWLRKDGLV